MQTVKATISPGYRWRLVLITFVMLGFGAFCIYDWQIRYPAKKEKYDAYLQVREQYPDRHPEVWSTVAAERGWQAYPAPEKKTDTDILTQLVMALIVLPIGLYFLYKLFNESRRWVALEGDRLTARGGHDLQLSDIQRLDDSRWKSKGIAYVHYPDPAGRERSILLDDFKMQRDPTKHIVERIQITLNPEAHPVEGTTPETAEAEHDGETLAKPTSPTAPANQ